jgi:SpoVK/Ycf46/Vps4 family AAA+-type ATPase
MRDEEQETTAKDLIQREIVGHIEVQGHDLLGRKKITGRRSGLLFGPPGTSKTSLVRAIAKKIGWPLVELNPSDFLKDGLENIYSQANEIFSDLKDLWQTVILFDEMDALAQKRAEGIDVTRQFLTTSMLPKLSMLHDESRVLFFMATNHQRQFDDAIKRPGRFDLLICMAPPLWSEKIKTDSLRKFLPRSDSDDDVEFVRKALTKWVQPDDYLAQTLDLFTFGEFKSFLESLRKGDSSRVAIRDLNKTAFRNKVEEWGGNLIALRAWKAEDMTKGDLSLRDEYDLDKTVSVKQ